MVTRPDSIFKSTKHIVQDSASGARELIGGTVEGIKMIRAELANTTRINAVENDAEYDFIVISQITDILDQLENITDSKADTIKARILEKRLAKLEALVG